MENKNTTSFRKTLGWAAAGIGAFLVAHALIKEISKFRLDGKVVVIMGGSTGLGLVLARALATRGAKLAIGARSADKLELTRQELERLGASVLAIPVDVSDENQVAMMIHDVISRYGRLDVVINTSDKISQKMQTVLKGRNINVITVAPNLLTQPTEITAQNIIKGIEYGETETVLALSGKLASVVKAVAPGWIKVLLTLANNFLPNPVQGNFESQKALESTPELSKERVALLEQKARRN